VLVIGINYHKSSISGKRWYATVPKVLLEMERESVYVVSKSGTVEAVEIMDTQMTCPPLIPNLILGIQNTCPPLIPNLILGIQNTCPANQPN